MGTAMSATQVRDTQSHAYSPGLEGVIAGESALCLVDEGESGLLYRGYGIADLADQSFSVYRRIAECSGKPAQHCAKQLIVGGQSLPQLRLKAVVFVLKRL